MVACVPRYSYNQIMCRLRLDDFTLQDAQKP
jgi:hypothetical protein